MKATALAALALSALATPAFAGPYVSTKSEFKFSDDNYKEAVNQARVGYDWKVGIANPAHHEKILGYINVEDFCVFTSGNFPRGLKGNDKSFYHIIDPRTGLPADSCQSVTVVGPDPTICDGLSTSIFVLGFEKGKLMLKLFQGYETLVVNKRGEILKTGGFPKLLN